MSYTYKLQQLRVGAANCTGCLQLSDRQINAKNVVYLSHQLTA